MQVGQRNTERLGATNDGFVIAVTPLHDLFNQVIACLRLGIPARSDAGVVLVQGALNDCREVQRDTALPR